MKQTQIIILDYGNHQTQQLARKIRDQHVFVEVVYHDTDLNQLNQDYPNLKGIIASGKAPNLTLNSPHLVVGENELDWENINNFLFDVCQVNQDWYIEQFITNAVANIKETVGDDQVILGLSGGVDSSVTAALINKAIGHQLTAILVDTGLLRLNEADKVMETYAKNFDLQIKRVDASQEFYDALKGITDPETKRKTIGKLFIDVFAREAKKFSNAKFLAQGTIYPDVIESMTPKAKVIKSHHNVGGLPEDLEFELLEPLRNLFKDEVREVGKKLGIPEKMVQRHPFPGPGLGVRILGEITKEKADILRQADDIFISLLEEKNLYHQVKQAHVVLLPVKTVGVVNDERTYAYACALRSIDTTDFMTAKVSQFNWEFLDEVTRKIISEVKDINRVVYDLTPKPPGTIEWE